MPTPVSPYSYPTVPAAVISIPNQRSLPILPIAAGAVGGFAVLSILVAILYARFKKRPTGTADRPRHAIDPESISAHTGPQTTLSADRCLTQASPIAQPFEIVEEPRNNAVPQDRRATPPASQMREGYRQLVVS